MPAQNQSQGGLLTIDIGSTVVKIAQVNASGSTDWQQFRDRDYDRAIVDQVRELLSEFHSEGSTDELFVCSSANGGLRVGVIALSTSYSGAILRDQALLGGANPMYVQPLEDMTPQPDYVDVLLVGGALEGIPSAAMTKLVESFSPDLFNFGRLAFAGNGTLAEAFGRRFPDAIIIDNPMPDDLRAANDSVFVALRDAYLDDLVYKEGINEVASELGAVVCPTPEVVSRGYYSALTQGVIPDITGASLLVDIGGATTDLHYSVEIVRDDSESRPAGGRSIARYVFTDLGVFASSDSVTLQLRTNPRTFEFLATVGVNDVAQTYRLLREGDYELSASELAHACLFLALDRFSTGNGPGLPAANLDRLDKLVLTGGAAQMIPTAQAAAIASLFTRNPFDERFAKIDSDYEIWIQGAQAHRKDQQP